MFAKIFALFAVLAVAFAAPNPNPQVITYTTGVDYSPYYTAGVVPVAPYSAVAYSTYPAVPGTVYVR